MMQAMLGLTQLGAYWGKAKPGPDTVLDHHSIVAHSLDVASCALELVVGSPLLARRLGSRSASDETVGLAIATACALHDIGKLDTRFQRKVPVLADRLRPHTAGVEVGPYDHGTEGFRLVETDAAAREFLAQGLGSEAVVLLRAVCGHHGSLPTRDQPSATRMDLPRVIRREDERARRDFIVFVLDFFRSRGRRDGWPTSVDGAAVQRLAGVCAVADWLGSNVDHFPYRAIEANGDALSAYWDNARERARRACAEAGLVRSPIGRSAFSDLFRGYAPRDVQVLTEQVASAAPSLVIIEAEMGKGKTEAAISLAARFLAEGHGDGLTFSLPTMATSNAMFARVGEVVRRLFPSHPVQLALAHGRARRNPGFQAVVDRGLRPSDPDAPEASVVCARWLLNRKRILLAQVGVGTIDQSLQAALLVRHQFVRMFGLSRNVVIIDEVHAYDAYMEVLLEHLLAWLGALDVPVVLLSATLPEHRRLALAKAWRGTLGADARPGTESAEVAGAQHYPLVTIATKSGTSSLAMPEPGDSRCFGLEITPFATEVKAVVERLVRGARAGARVAWIRNTVREAQDAFAALDGLADGVEHTLFHARFRASDRARIEAGVLERFGKGAPRGGRVLVATQVVEQSLDLDFDELHTDLAPVDLLFQRAGRLHRHQRDRPNGFTEPRLVVHGRDEAEVAALCFGPSLYVYDAGTLWLTDRLLRPRRSLRLPSDIRPLVEAVYHPAARRTLRAGHTPLAAAEERLESVLEARRTKARRCCIAPTSAEPDGGAAPPDDEDAVQAFTRDGESVTLLPLWWSGSGGRSLDAAESEPEWDLDAGRHGAWDLATAMLDQTLSISGVSSFEPVVPSEERAAWERWRRLFVRFAEETTIGCRVVPVPLRRREVDHHGEAVMRGRPHGVGYSARLGFLIASEREEEATA